MAEQAHIYDSSLKALIQDLATEILPFLFPGVTYEHEVNVEVITPAKRADKVFQVMYRGQHHLLHIEFETSSDGQMAQRLLTYHAGLHHDHKLPVLSMIVYPFRTAMVESPFRELSGEEEILTFHYRVMPLWKMSAAQYVQQHAISMYALLPTMQEASDDLLLAAIDEMAEHYVDQEAMLARQLIWMGVLLRRSSTISVETKQRVQERLIMLERLWEEDPKIQQLQRSWEAKGEAKGKIEGEARGRAEGEAKGRAEGEAKGEVKGKREMVIAMVELRFPELSEFVQQRIENITAPEDLKRLFKLLTLASDEAAARSFLDIYLS